MRTIVTRSGARTAEEAMRESRIALDRPLEGDAELTVAELTTAATSIGAFARHHGSPDDVPRTKRGSGGPFVSVGPGTLHVLLALRTPAALVPGDARRIVNRHVRPLLRGLTKSGALAHYFGREWLSVGHRPVGQVGFAHDSRTGRALFEALVAVRHPFVLEPAARRASFLGKDPATIESVVGRTFELAVLRERIVDAYADSWGYAAEPRAFEAETSEAVEVWDDPPWAATRPEAIGWVGAGVDAAGVLRLGGDLGASRDALERVAAAVAALPKGAREDQVGAIVFGELTREDIALFGVRDLHNLRDVLFAAR